VVVALGSAANFEHLQSLKLPCVASARFDAANSRATIEVAESFKRRDVIDALAAAELPHELFDAAAAAAATSEAAEAREALVWKIHLVLSIVIAIPLALIAFVFVDDVSQLVRVIVGFVLCSISQLRIGYPLYVSAYKSLALRARVQHGLPRDAVDHDRIRLQHHRIDCLAGCGRRRRECARRDVL
jgi:cation transport ATPase